MQVLSFNSRILTTQEQKVLTYDQELCAITFVLSQYVFKIIGSNFPITVLTDHIPILFLFTRKGNLTPRQYKAQMLLTKLSNLQFYHTAGTNLTVADMLSLDVSQISIKMCWLQHKALSNFIHDCIECQANELFPMKPNNVFPPLPFYENAIHFNYRISLDTNGPISPSSQENSFFVFNDAFSHFVVNNPAPYVSANNAIQTPLQHWITKFGPIQYILTDTSSLRY